MFVLYLYVYLLLFFFFFKQKTAYEMRISDWSSDVCSSDLSSKLIPLAISIASMPRNGQVRLSAPRLYSMNRILPLNATPHLSSKRAHGLSRFLNSLTVNPELHCPMLGQPHLMEIDSRLWLTPAFGWSTRFLQPPPTPRTEAG